MSGGGMLAAALAGGTGAIYGQATGDIEQQRKVDIARETAAIEEQMRMRLAENHERLRMQGKGSDLAFDTNAANVAAVQGKKRSDTLASAQDTRDATVAAVNDTGYQGAVKKQADTDAADAATRKRAAVTAEGNDSSYLASVTKVALADPKTAAVIAKDRAQAAEAGARAGLLHSGTVAADMNNDDKRKLNGLYDQMSSVLADGKLSDEERATQLKNVERQIQVMKDRSGRTDDSRGRGAGRDPELDTQTVKETKINPDGSTSETTRKEVRKAGNGSATPSAGPAVGTEVDGYVFNGGDPKDKANWARKSAAAAPRASAAPATSAAADPLAFEKRWIQTQLMGAFAGTNRLEEIAKANANPKLRAAAQEMLDEQASRAETP